MEEGRRLAEKRREEKEKKVRKSKVEAKGARRRLDQSAETRGVGRKQENRGKVRRQRRTQLRQRWKTIDKTDEMEEHGKECDEPRKACNFKMR